MKLQIHANIGVQCIEFLKRKLGRFDTNTLEYFRLYDRTGTTATHGTWGRCTFPNRRKQLGYRIRCSVSITTREFPHRIKWAIGTRQLGGKSWEWVWREDRFHTKEEAFVWIAGHEAFHWLRHSRQIPGKNYETQANRYGFVWLDEWRASLAVGKDGLATGSLQTEAKTVRVDRFHDQPLGCSPWPPLPKGVHAASRAGMEAL